ncbi:UDP-2,4-diacetamido-2,4,6-trideoxy-beta-L-altropyranose hydrolase [Paenibacillus frigoriresistens]|uniref:UDP-2,4-diacetamido-2,4, 6-trideoxy-beta-L-altropyranose hydrolase n=1 Tax=Paenibacillus alginolyticus TaxID=59839 RepID=UPI001563B3D3|nr:UDP-2,4-diacetamido-2,4,6-trideoxy-beta-L-altropyranose hydrolase [Paenibacillus frigoriresistens]NRF93665.1 UDP-2,4-diacetamido-2,4,6-trideoxy-beta-L-altropyranose hydrolase [Paenibacillus frigoriresistens]
MKKKVVLFRCDASQQIGVGHVMRCLSLAQQVEKLNMDCVFLTNAGGDDVLRHYASFPIFTSRYSPNESEIDQIIKIAEKFQASYAVWDSYDMTVDGVAEVQNHIPLMILDDVYLLPHYSCDAVLNQNLYADPQKYSVNHLTTILTRSQYTLLRSSFREYMEKDREISLQMPARLMLSFGGSDSDDLTSLIIGWLIKLDFPIHFDIVLGPHYAFKSGLLEFVAADLAPNHKFMIHDNVRNMAELFIQQDIVICAGGSTLYEVACLGIPSCCIITADNQVELAKAAEEHGFSKNLGYIDEINPEFINSIIEDLIIDHKKRIHMSEIGKVIVDGLGAYRVASYILEKVHGKGGI